MHSINKYLSHMEACQKSQDFCEWLEYYQKAVWHRIGYSRLRGLKVYEAAITQNLVFDLALKNFLNVQILESKDEKANGSDLLIDIFCDKGSKKFAVQAKIAYKNESFPMIEHVVKKTNSRQIDLLINFAKNNGWHPAYMFYGYKKSSSNDNYGISIADAYAIKINYLSTPSAVTIPTQCLTLLHVALASLLMTFFVVNLGMQFLILMVCWTSMLIKIFGLILFRMV
jgi:hypothetical protein